MAIVAMAAVLTWLHIQVKDARVGRERLWTTLLCHIEVTSITLDAGRVCEVLAVARHAVSPPL